MLKKGTQIIYVPNHVEIPNEPTLRDMTSLEDNKECELGFVAKDTPTRNSHVFCRYWSRYAPKQLRTRGNSESTPADRVLPWTSVSQEIVDAWLTIIEYENLDPLP